MTDTEGALKKSIGSGKWMFINTVSQKIIVFASFLILARLLTPGDFGILAILMIVPNFMILVSTTGLETAIIQKRDGAIEYLNPVWTLNVLKSIVIFLAIFFFAPFIAKFFKIQEALPAIRISGLIVLAAGTANIAQLFFFRDLDFKKIFIRDTAGTIVYAVIALGLAALYRSFWPLFWGTVAMHITATISTYLLHEFRPSFDFRFKKFFGLIEYSKWVYAQNTADRIISTVENSLIAKMLGVSDVGLYTRAKSLASAPLSPFYNIINRVAFPAYSRVQDSYEKIADGFLKSLDVLFFISAPTAFLFIAAGHRIVLIMLGEKWVGMAIILKIIVAAFAASAFSSAALPIFNAIGRPQIKFWLTFVNLALLSIFLPGLIYFYGLTGAALALIFTYALTSLIAIIALTKNISIKFGKIIKSPLIPTMASLATLIVGRFALKYLEPLTDIGFMALVALLGAIYLGLVIACGKMLKTGPYETIWLILSETFGLKTKSL